MLRTPALSKTGRKAEKKMSHEHKKNLGPDAITEPSGARVTAMSLARIQRVTAAGNSQRWFAPPGPAGPVGP